MISVINSIDLSGCFSLLFDGHTMPCSDKRPFMQFWDTILPAVPQRLAAPTTPRWVQKSLLIGFP
ncbi:MAG: hypothetical protein WC525_05955 [Candidatus Thermoplasmatota archaeon]